MSPSIDPKETHLEIGLSREDQERIEALREVRMDVLKKRGHFFERLNKMVIGWTKIKIREKVTFFQLLAVMINAGMPIIRSLYVLSDQMGNLRLKEIIRQLALDMEEGKSLSQAMEPHSSLFAHSEIGMIASGEASGNLNDILKDIAKQAEKSAVILSKVRGAMMYPLAILIVMGICLFLILTMVVPKLMSLFNEGGQELPLATTLLMQASEFARSYWFVILFLALAFALGLYFVRQTRKGRFSIDLAVLHLPVFGKIIRQLMIARFCRMLTSLMKAGVPIVKGLTINANALGNEVYRQRVEFSAQDVAQGIPLGENLTGSDFLFPPMVASMVLVGEQTANLAEVSAKIADYYENEVDTAVSSLSKLMEPMILVVMGLMVGFIVMAVMQPIINLSDISVGL
jgi:type IV pilus assembly protein PilC